MSSEVASRTAAPTATAEDQPHLKRVLGRRDLILLFVVAVFNLNVLPSIAANGSRCFIAGRFYGEDGRHVI